MNKKRKTPTTNTHTIKRPKPNTHEFSFIEESFQKKAVVDLADDVFNHYDLFRSNFLKYRDEGPGAWLIYTLATGVANYMDNPVKPIYAPSESLLSFSPELKIADYDPNVTAKVLVCYFANHSCISHRLVTLIYEVIGFDEIPNRYKDIEIVAFNKI
jgi:hypothetical protein